MKWISIKERKPKATSQFERFLVATNHGVGVAVFDNLNGFSELILSGGLQHVNFYVTHWMPLPQPPAE
jgi:hypothetical protein